MNRIKPRDSRNLFFHDGVWRVDIQIKGQRHREKAGATEARARDYRDKLRSWGRDSAKGLPTRRPEGEAVTFAETADNYLNLYSKLEKRSGSGTRFASPTSTPSSPAHGSRTSAPMTPPDTDSRGGRRAYRRKRATSSLPVSGRFAGRPSMMVSSPHIHSGPGNSSQK